VGIESILIIVLVTYISVLGESDSCLIDIMSSCIKY